MERHLMYTAKWEKHNPDVVVINNVTVNITTAHSEQWTIADKLALASLILTVLLAFL